MTIWINELDKIKTMIDDGVGLEKIGDVYGVSRQRIYQVLTKYGISTPCHTRKGFLKGKGPEKYWLDRILRTKKISKALRLWLLEHLETPEYCPALGIKLNYDGVEKSGWTRTDSSPSLDRLDSSKGYELGNLQILSWRANRIKNDSTPEELMKIAKYMECLQNNA